MSTRTLLVSASLAAMMLATPAVAQTNDIDSSNDPEDAVRSLQPVLVTATRREGSVQNIGAALSAFDENALETRSVQSVEDLADLSPGLQISTYQGDTSIFVRGIGTPVIIAGADSSTATYADGVYLSRAAAIGPAFFDVERVEVLRGPQGTLYGRNATGGAVKIITKRPSDAFEGEARLILGDYDRIQAFGAVSGPIGDGLRARLAVQKETRSGYTEVTSPLGNFDAEDKDDLSVRLTFEADLSESVLLTLRSDYYTADDRANVFHFASLGYQEEVDDWLSSREGSQTLPYFAIKTSGRVSAPASRNIYSGVDYYNDTKVWGVSGQLDWQIGAYDLQAIIGYKDTQPDFLNSFDLGERFNTYINRAEDHQQWNADVQLASPTSGPISWIIGAGYFTEENDIENNIFGDFWEPILIQGLTDLQTAGILPPFPIDIPESTLCCELHLNGRQETDAVYAFVDADWALTETLTLKAGIRFSEEERDGRQAFDLTILPTAPGGVPIRFAPEVAFFPNAVSDSRDGVQPDPFGFVVAPVEGPATFDATTPKIALEWEPASDTLLYVSAQRGFKSGGYNIGSNQRTPFEPEEIWAYEAGLKSSLASNRLQINAAGFFYDYTNLQAQDSIGNQPIIRNVGKAEVKGAEFEFAALLTDMITMDGSATYVDATFTEGSLTEPLRPAPLTQPPGTLLTDLDGKRLPRAPEWKLNLGAQADFSALGGDMTVRADYSWQDEIYFTVFNIEAASQDAYGVWRARASYRPHDSQWRFAVFGENLSDETYFTNQILTGTVYGAEFVGSLGAPRTVGFEAAVTF